MARELLRGRLEEVEKSLFRAETVPACMDFCVRTEDDDVFAGSGDIVERRGELFVGVTEGSLKFAFVGEESMPWARMESITSISPRGSIPVSVGVACPRPARIVLEANTEPSV